MLEYHLCVALADQAPIDGALEALIRRAVEEANARRNAQRKGRKFAFAGMLDPLHFHLVLQSDSEVIPTRALSALTRSILDLDEGGILGDHVVRGAVFSARELLPGEKKTVTALSDVALAQEVTELLFGQQTMTLKNKKRAQQACEQIREIVIAYLTDKSLL